jgi:hypothetical protein
MKTREISRANLESMFSVSETVCPSIIMAWRDVHLKKQPVASSLMTDSLIPPHHSLGGDRWKSRDRTMLHK